MCHDLTGIMKGLGRMLIGVEWKDIDDVVKPSEDAHIWAWHPERGPVEAQYLGQNGINAEKNAGEHLFLDIVMDQSFVGKYWYYLPHLPFPI